jgi:hypothetical protein
MPCPFTGPIFASMMAAGEGTSMRFASLCLAAVALTACQSTSTDTAPPAARPPAPAIPAPAGSAALDSSVVITPPDTKVPKQYAAFSGVWAGTWDGPLDAKLAVRTIAPDGRVTVTYAWGSLGDMKPGIVDGQGRIGGSTMRLERFASGVDTSFTMQGDGTLAGTATVSGVTSHGIFHRQ